MGTQIKNLDGSCSSKLEQGNLMKDYLFYQDPPFLLLLHTSYLENANSLFPGLIPPLHMPQNIKQNIILVILYLNKSEGSPEKIQL